MAKDIKGFTFYKSYFETLEEFDIEEQKDLIYSMIKFVYKDEEPKFKDKSMRIAWTLIKPLLEKSKNKSNGNSGAPMGNQNARKYDENKEEKQKQSKNNQTYQDKSLSISISNYLSNIIINNNNNINNIYNLFKEYINIRYKNKYTISDTVIKRLINKLNEYGKTDKDKIEILEKAINGSWKDFYELEKEEKNRNRTRKVL